MGCSRLCHIGCRGEYLAPGNAFDVGIEPVYSGLFDSSGWAMNWGGEQHATSSPANKVAPVVSAPGQSAMASGGSAVDGNMLLIGGAALLLLLLIK